MARPTINGKPMTTAERARRYREAKSKRELLHSLRQVNTHPDWLRSWVVGISDDDIGRVQQVLLDLCEAVIAEKHDRNTAHNTR